MIKKEEFLLFMQDLINDGTITDEGIIEYINEMATSKAFTPKEITDKGKVILKDMQDNLGENKFKAKDIGDRLGVSGRSVSGSMRSLIALGYAEKVNADPVMYGLTDKGMNFEFDN